MSISAIIASFVQDTKLAAVLIVIAIDFVLGIAAAYKLGTFKLSYIGTFFRDDILFKVVPWFLFYAADKVTHNATLVIGIDFSTIANAAFVVVLAWLVGSLTSSLADLGIGMPPALARGEHQ